MASGLKMSGTGAKCSSSATTRTPSTGSSSTSKPSHTPTIDWLHTRGASHRSPAVRELGTKNRCCGALRLAPPTPLSAATTIVSTSSWRPTCWPRASTSNKEEGVHADINFTETREEIERIRREDAALFERGGTAKGALSGEEFRQELRQALEDAGLAEQIRSLPWGSGSGRAVAAARTGPGYVFCARVGDHPSPVFRFVGRGKPGMDVVVDETLTCLDRARPPQGLATPRVLDDADAHGAFDAWETARADIVEK